MGKVKSRRQKYHISAVKSSTTITSSEKPISFAGSNDVTENDWPMPSVLLNLPQPVFPSVGLFSGLNIPKETLVKQKLDDCETRGVVSLGKKETETHISKKEKRKKRRDNFLQKLEAAQVAQKKELKRKQRQKTPIIGDLHPMIEALEDSTKSSKPKKKQPTKVRSIKKAKIRKKEALKDIKLFRSALEHPLFKADPEGTISEHVRNRMKAEANLDLS